MEWQLVLEHTHLRRRRCHACGHSATRELLPLSELPPLLAPIPPLKPPNPKIVPPPPPPPGCAGFYASRAQWHVSVTYSYQ